MSTKSFPGKVVNGQLLIRTSLEDIEGREVEITIFDRTADSNKGYSFTDTEEDATPPVWMEIENDAIFQSPRKATTVYDSKVVDKGRARPKIILPENLPDE